MEEKIFELEQRIEKLEKKEKRRRNLLIAKISTVALLIILILVCGYIAVKEIQETIKPYKEFIEKQQDFSNDVNDSIDKGVNTVKGLFN